MCRVIVAAIVGAALGGLLAAFPAVREPEAFVITELTKKPSWEGDDLLRTDPAERLIPYVNAGAGAAAGGLVGVIALLTSARRRRGAAAGRPGAPSLAGWVIGLVGVVALTVIGFAVVAWVLSERLPPEWEPPDKQFPEPEQGPEPSH